MLANDIPELVNYIKNYANRLDNSKELIDIYENDLLKYVERMLKHEMGEQTFAQIVTRIPPINMVKKVVDSYLRSINQVFCVKSWTALTQIKNYLITTLISLI